MKKSIFVILLLAMATTAITAQELYTTVPVGNATLLQPAGKYLYYGNQVMNKKQCVDFLATRHQAAYETFHSGYKCYVAGWVLASAGLTLDLAGSILLACASEDGQVMRDSGDALIITGCAAILAAVPTVFIGYSRLNKGIDTFNMSQASAAPQAYWTIQGSENGHGLALHF